MCCTVFITRRPQVFLSESSVRSICFATPLFGLLAISSLALVILSILSLVRRKEKIAGFTGEMLGEIWIFYLLAAAILVTHRKPGAELVLL